MCNNRPMTVVKKVEKEEHSVKSALALIKSDEDVIVKLNDENKLFADKEAKSNSVRTKEAIYYSMFHPLKMINGSEVHAIEIYDCPNGEYKYATIEFLSTLENPENEINTKAVRIHKNETIEDIEEYLLSCVSCFQIANLDLDFLEGVLEIA